MTAHECPDPETLAVFALGQSSGEEWRHVVRHLADCAICRRQVALTAEKDDVALPPGEPVRVLPFPQRTRLWQHIAQGIAAAALLAAGIAWALVHRPAAPNVAKETPAPNIRPQPAPEKPNVPRPAPPEPVFAQPEKTPAPPPEHFIPRPKPTPEKPAPDVVKTPPAPSPFLAERASSMVAEAIEVTAGEGTVSRRSGEIVTPLLAKTMIQPSDTLLSPVGGSVLLSDGATVHLGRESELRLSWSQTLACATVDVRKGDAVVDLGKTARPLHVAHGPLGLHLRDSAGLLLVSAGEQSLRTTPLSGATQFRTRGGDARRLDPLQSLVLGEVGDRLEAIEKADVSAFPTLGSKGRPAPPTPPPSEKKPPLLDVLLTGLGQQSYAYRVSGRQVRDGVWSPSGFFTATVEEFTSAKRLDDKEAAHLRRGSRAWDDLGKVSPGGRDARLLEIVRGSQAPHLMVLEILGSVRGESAPRTDKVRDRICVSWDLALDPTSLRPFMEKIFESSVAEGRLEKPDAIFWDTLEGSLECSALKFDSKLLRIIDRRKVSYSYRTVGGLDRRTYQLETVYEFFSHGVAAMLLPPEMIKELSSPKK
ncbi:MAG TPA: hypothetical protein VNM14_25650 [Planctomycetota bacterium]|jgi:hypothetical protein|nr:hypothetical protein [Planctomycetota bacterium]